MLFAVKTFYFTILNKYININIINKYSTLCLKSNVSFIRKCEIPLSLLYLGWLVDRGHVVSNILSQFCIHSVATLIVGRFWLNDYRLTAYL